MLYDSKTLKKLDTIQDKAALLIDITSPSIQSLRHQCSIAAECTTYKDTLQKFTRYPSTAPSKPRHFHVEGQEQQLHANTITCKFLSNPLTILTRKYIDPFLQGQDPEIPSLRALWVNLQHMDCSGSRRQLTSTFSRATGERQKMLAQPVMPTSHSRNLYSLLFWTLIGSVVDQLVRIMKQTENGEKFLWAVKLEDDIPYSLMMDRDE
eukprot:g32012.t1